MKLLISKKILLLLFLFFNTAFVFSQKDKLKVHSFSFGTGIMGYPSNGMVGPNVNLDFSTEFKKNIVSIYLAAGTPVESLISERNNYKEANLTYGKEIKLNSWINMEGHLGFGYFNHIYEDESFSKISRSTIGFPFRLKLIFYPFWKHLGTCFNPNINLNSVRTVYSFNLTIQVKF